MATGVDRERSAARIEREIETLSGPDFTTSSQAIRRYAYTPEYRRTLDHFTAALAELGFTVTEDPVGTLVARNRPPGEPTPNTGSPTGRLRATSVPSGSSATVKPSSVSAPVKWSSVRRYSGV